MSRAHFLPLYSESYVTFTCDQEKQLTLNSRPYASRTKSIHFCEIIRELSPPVRSEATASISLAVLRAVLLLLLPKRRSVVCFWKKMNMDSAAQSNSGLCVGVLDPPSGGGLYNTFLFIRVWFRFDVLCTKVNNVVLERNVKRSQQIRNKERVHSTIYHITRIKRKFFNHNTTIKPTLHK